MARDSFRLYFQVFFKNKSNNGAKRVVCDRKLAASLRNDEEMEHATHSGIILVFSEKTSKNGEKRVTQI